MGIIGRLRGGNFTGVKEDYFAPTLFGRAYKVVEVTKKCDDGIFCGCGC